MLLYLFGVFWQNRSLGHYHPTTFSLYVHTIWLKTMCKELWGITLHFLYHNVVGVIWACLGFIPSCLVLFSPYLPEHSLEGHRQYCTATESLDDHTMWLVYAAFDNSHQNSHLTVYHWTLWLGHDLWPIAVSRYGHKIQSLMKQIQCCVMAMPTGFPMQNLNL